MSARESRRGLLALGLSVLLVVVLRAAWVSDDAYISFRTLENFLGGHGLRYNPAERVQAFTHPLWIGLLLPFRLLTGEYYYASLALSTLATLAAVSLLAMGVARDLWMALFGIVALTLSKSFVDYSTSGLENPLAHVLLVAFFWIFLTKAGTPRRTLVLVTLAGLAALTRMDAVVLYLPAVALAWLGTERSRARLAALAGLVPLGLWEVLSIVYYGFAFPNTAYAKLGTGIPRASLLEQGGLYLVSSLARDPLSFALLLAGLALALARRDAKGLAIALGMGLHLGYVVAIGGDFMAGRFLTPLVLLSVVVIASTAPLRGWPWAAGAALVVALGLGAHRDGEIRDARDVADERAYYAPYTGLSSASRRSPLPAHPWALEGLAALEAGPAVVVRDTIGLFGFYAGPDVHVVDVYALADPLLARLPARAEPNWRPGHFAREIPEGYLASLEHGDNELTDERLARFYDHLRIVTRGPLFSLERWRAIVALNLGLAASEIDADRYRYPRRRSFSSSSREGEARVVTGSGARIALERPASALVELELDCDDDYVVRFLRGERELGSARLPRLCLEGGGLRWRTLGAPEQARASRFDALWVLPERGRRPYAIGAVRAY